MLTMVHDQVCITGQQLIPVDKVEYREEERVKGKREKGKTVFFFIFNFGRAAHIRIFLRCFCSAFNRPIYKEYLVLILYALILPQ